MTDLDRAIRDRLDPDQWFLGRQELRSALLAVLDLNPIGLVNSPSVAYMAAGHSLALDEMRRAIARAIHLEVSA
jgi:hypothetical protein